MVISKNSLLSLFFTVLVLVCRLGSFICSPLWLDYFRSFNETDHNTSTRHYGNSSQHEIRQSQPFFILFMQAAVPTLLWGLVLMIILILSPKHFGTEERKYPRKLLLIPGLSMSLSAVLVNYSLSGSRTPPYLQALLGNFAVPIQFIVR